MKTILGRYRDRVMEPSAFLRRPHRILKVMSVNVNGVKTKIVKQNVQNVLMSHDVIRLTEIKTPLMISLPGYTSFYSFDRDNPRRSGTCVLGTAAAELQMTDVDLSKPDQVWLRLRCMPGFCSVSCTSKSTIHLTSHMLHLVMYRRLRPVMSQMVVCS